MKLVEKFLKVAIAHLVALVLIIAGWLAAERSGNIGLCLAMGVIMMLSVTILLPWSAYYFTKRYTGSQGIASELCNTVCLMGISAMMFSLTSATNSPLVHSFVHYFVRSFFDLLLAGGLLIIIYRTIYPHEI